MCKVSSRDMDKIIWLHNRQILSTGVSHDKLKIVWHTLGLTSRIKGKTKNKRMFLSGVDMSNIAVQRTVDDHTHAWLRVRAMHEMGREATEYWSASNLMWQFRLLRPNEHGGIIRDGQGCHHLPPTPQPEKAKCIHMFPCTRAPRPLTRKLPTPS
jgi:hypothetical protein